MKLMVAGCSFSAVSKTHLGTHWSELIAKDLGWDLENLARRGCSNGGIRLQIDEIICQRPDFAIIGPTFHDRTEIPVLGYDASLGIGNINYDKKIKSPMIYETIFSLVDNIHNEYREGISKETQAAMVSWFSMLYDTNWKKQQDEWIISDGILKMFHAGINFLVWPCLLWPWDKNNNNLWREAFIDIIPDHYIMLEEKESPLPITGNNPFKGEDPGYHGNEESQKIIAKNWLHRIKTDFGL
jgi:hypothetical protein